MPRKKKEIKENTSEGLPKLAEPSKLAEPVKNQIAPLGLDLGREDLNALVKKVNEVIEKVNQ